MAPTHHDPPSTPRDADEAARRGRPPTGGRDPFGRLRVTTAERAQAWAVQAGLYPEADTDSELIYRIWRRGLQLDLARLASLGGDVPAGMTEEALARLIAQDLLQCLPLLRRTGMLAFLQLEVPAEEATRPTAAPERAAEEFVDGASDGLGGADFI